MEDTELRMRVHNKYIRLLGLWDSVTYITVCKVIVRVWHITQL
jgi:hypothetical protein